MKTVCPSCKAPIACPRCKELEQELETARAELANLEANALEAIRRLTAQRDDFKALLEKVSK